MKNSASNPHIVIVALSGIGNLIMQLPMADALKATYPNSRITAWVAPRGTKVLAQNAPSIDEVIEMPIKTSMLGHIHNIRRLRSLKADIGIVASPGQQIKSAAYLFLAGISIRVGHTYPFKGNSNSKFLLTNAISEKENTHDIEQNLALLSALQLPIPHIPYYSITIPAEAKAKAQEFIKGLSLDPTKPIIGFHAGSAPDFLWKRWPLENFAALGRKLIAEQGAQIFLFGGKNEAEQNESIKNMIANPSSVTSVQADLMTVVAIMQACRIFISNDSGLMHVAAASGVETFGLFGPTDEKETGPRGPKSHVIRASGTKPAYNTEKNYSLGEEPHETILAITPEMVLEKVQLV